MANSVQDILRLIRDEEIQMVDFKMVDIHGQFRHVTIPAENFSEDMMTDGVGFDASNYGYAVVEKSDMVFIPDLDTAYIACLFSNNENDFVWARIDRDLEEEESTILQLQQFWDRNVRSRVEPPLAEKPDLVLETLRRYYGSADRSAPKLSLRPGYGPALAQICDLKDEKKALEAQVRALDQKIKTLYAPIVNEMGTACIASCEDGGEIYSISYSPQYREGICKDRLSALKAQYPEIYDDFVERTESRIFKVTRDRVS